LLKEFLVVCPPSLIEQYYKAEMKIKMVNGAEIIFRHLDKIAEQELRSLNLGAAFIDQAEDIDKKVFLALLGRLRREGIKEEDRKLIMSMNPELTWHFAEFKQNPKEHYELIEASTYENRENLPLGYIEQMEQNYPEDYRRQYMDGVWDESLLAGNAVFSREYIEKMGNYTMKPIKTYEGLLIYKTFEHGHRYQMGIDVAEGSEEETDKKDKSAITIADLDTIEEVAHWSGQVPPDVVAEKAASFARLYQRPNSPFCTIIPEMNSIGLALVNKLKQEEDIHIYRREEFDKSVGKKMKKLGWRTTRQSKPLLVNHFQELLRKKEPKVRTQATFEEFKTFIYTDDSRKAGIGAKTGFHDDRIISCLLAFFEKGEVVGGKVLNKADAGRKIKVDVVPTLVIRDGKARLPGLKPILETANKWTTH
jgi:hypothetical protein